MKGIIINTAIALLMVLCQNASAGKSGLLTVEEPIPVITSLNSTIITLGTSEFFKRTIAKNDAIVSPNSSPAALLTPQTITFPPLTNQPYGTPPFTISATASSGLAVVFSSATPSVCTVSGTTVTLLAVGICTIHANQPGNGTYSAAPQVAQSFSVYTIPPNPTSDAGVTGLVNAQVITAQLFAQNQINHLTDHLMDLHQQFNPRKNKVNIGLRTGLLHQYQEFASASRGMITNHAQNKQQNSSLWHNTTNVTPDQMSGENLSSYNLPNLDSIALTDLTVNNLLFNRLSMSLWGTGDASYGKINFPGNSSEHFTLEGLTAGVDFQAHKILILGVAVGYASDRSTINNINAVSSAHQLSFSGYTTYQPIKNWFIDGLIGYGTPTFSNSRQSFFDGQNYFSNRDGNTTYGSVGLSNLFKIKSIVTQLFTRADIVAAKLNQYLEQGGTMPLSYNSLNASNTSWSTGVYLSKVLALETWIFTPSARAQYSYNSGSNNNQGTFYTNLGPSLFNYNFNVANLPQNMGSLSLWLDLTKISGGSLAIGWMGSAGSADFIMNSIQLKVSYPLG